MNTVQTKSTLTYTDPKMWVESILRVEKASASKGVIHALVCDEYGSRSAAEFMRSDIAPDLEILESILGGLEAFSWAIRQPDVVSETIRKPLGVDKLEMQLYNFVFGKLSQCGPKGEELFNQAIRNLETMWQDKPNRLQNLLFYAENVYNTSYHQATDGKDTGKQIQYLRDRIFSPGL